MSRVGRSGRALGWVAAVVFLAGAAAPTAAEEKAAPESGWVRLPLPEYDRLVRAARHPRETAPLGAAITSTSSSLETDAGGIGSSAANGPRLTTTLECVSLSDKPQVLALPEVGILYGAEVSGDGASVSIASAAGASSGESGQLELRLSRRGRFVVRLRSVPAREERAGVTVLAWAVPDSPSNRFTATLPRGYENVTLSGGTVSVSPERSGPVRVSGTLRRSEKARLSYAVAASRAPEEKLVASASESRLYRLGEKSLSVASRLRVEVLRGTLRTFAVEADPDLTVASAWAGENTVTSFERDPAHPGRLTLTLGREVTGGALEVFWLLKRPTEPDRGEIRMPEIGLPDFLRGETTVAVVSPRPLVLDESKGRREGYERIDESDLPPELREMADSTVLLALRRIGAAPPALALQISSFPDATGLSGIIDRAKVLTIATRDAGRIDRWQLELQTRDALVRIPLPAGATLWSLQVDGKPTRPLTEQGQLVVPLGRGEKSARPRRIEIVLQIPGALALTGRGTARIEIPRLPFPTTHAEWDLLLPETALYRYAGGSVAPAASTISFPTSSSALKSLQDSANGIAGGIVGNEVEADAVTVPGSGRLSGRAIDAQGGPLPGVTVMAVRQEGGYRRTAVTNPDGYFFFTELPGGTFRIQGQLAGFRSADRSVTLSEGSNLGADLKLSFVAAMEQVTVTAESPMVDARKMTTGATFTNNRAPGPPPVSRRDAAKVENQNRQVLSDEERASLQRTSEAGVAAIQVELPSEGKRLHFEANLLIDEAASIDLQFKPVKHGLW